MNQQEYNDLYKQYFKSASFKTKCRLLFMTYFGWTKLANYISKNPNE